MMLRWGGNTINILGQKKRGGPKGIKAKELVSKPPQVVVSLGVELVEERVQARKIPEKQHWTDISGEIHENVIFETYFQVVVNALKQEDGDREDKDVGLRNGNRSTLQKLVSRILLHEKCE
ncbi:hypothetical protein L6452_17883 [Arctium lappa]|uniref:Uncharacterized protein n=1 Tax=Arctium lappa TaxID=4217 RepID=A0ACB9C4V8_ARCLA|nr:hypothetical protein L6452_17883 [Arctium lappa]